MIEQGKPKDKIRAYYFGIALPAFMEQLGYEGDDRDSIHHELKVMFLGPSHPDENGITLRPEIMSDGVDINKKIKFIEWFKRKAEDLGAPVPEPEGGLGA